MKRVNISQARAQFSKLLRRVALGEEIRITKCGVPVARLVPFTEANRAAALGAYGDAIKIADDFDGPLPDEILDAFEGISRKKPKSR